MKAFLKIAQLIYLFFFSLIIYRFENIVTHGIFLNEKRDLKSSLNKHFAPF